MVHDCAARLITHLLLGLLCCNEPRCMHLLFACRLDFMQSHVFGDLAGVCLNCELSLDWLCVYV